jgi:TRAP-type transport system periplasmic protein
MTSITRRHALAGTAALAASFALPAVVHGQGKTTVRWGESLPPNHPQVQMAERIAKDVGEKSAGRIEIQIFPSGQLGTGSDMIEAVSSGALQFTTDGAGAIASFLPQLSVIEAPYLWRDAEHLKKLASAPIFASLNEALVAKRKMRMLAVTYYGKRHVTTGSKPVNTPADLVGLKLRVPPVDVFRAMVEAWGAKATPIAFAELYLALSQRAVDGQENPLPTIANAKLFEVQKFLILTEHIITPRLPLVNDSFWQGLPAADRALMQAAIDEAGAWQDKTLLEQEASLTSTLKGNGMTVITPDVALFRDPVLAAVPKKFEDKWGKGTWDTIRAL